MVIATLLPWLNCHTHTHHVIVSDSFIWTLKPLVEVGRTVGLPTHYCEAVQLQRILKCWQLIIKDCFPDVGHFLYSHVDAQHNWLGVCTNWTDGCLCSAYTMLTALTCCELRGRGKRSSWWLHMGKWRYMVVCFLRRPAKVDNERSRVHLGNK